MNGSTDRKILLGIVRLAAIFVLVLVLFILVDIFICLMGYVHEFGHILFGFIPAALIDRAFPQIIISNWIPCDLCPVLWIPQQTKIVKGTHTLGMAFGSIVLISIFLLVIWSILKNRLKEHLDRIVLKICLILLFLREIFLNVIGGTDNWTGKPLINGLPVSEIHVSLVLLMAIFVSFRVFDKLNRRKYNQSKTRQNLCHE